MTSTNPEFRAARKVLRMVAELHARGYQRLRVVAGLGGAGFWRCSITPIENTLRANGALCSDFDWLTARYTSADEREYFGWKDAAHATPSQLADLFIQRLPLIAARGYGEDWLYAGWYQHMLHLTYPDAFPIAYAEMFFSNQGWLRSVGGRDDLRIPLPPPGEATGGFGSHDVVRASAANKRARYAALVLARKHYDPTAHGPLTNPSQVDHGRFDAAHIGPWTRWAHDLDAELMVVGQDWGDVTYFRANYGLDNPQNPTNRALERLLASIGRPVPEPPATFDAGADAHRGSCGVWLTNALPWLKQAGLSAKVEETWFGEPVTGFLREQIEIVQPRVVVALGQQAYDCVLRAYGLPKRRGPFRAVVAGPGLPLPNTAMSKLIGVYHCGQRIQNTIRTLEEQMRDWQRVAEALAKP